MTLICENVLSRGIVGLPAKILESPDSTLQGIVGTVVFETKNTIFIREDFTVRQVAKRAAKKLQLQTPSCACFISGSALIGRPEDRISRLKKGDMINYG
jgi:ribonuclease P protein subunit POP4